MTFFKYLYIWGQADLTFEAEQPLSGVPADPLAVLPLLAMETRHVVQYLLNEVSHLHFRPLLRHISLHL